jgi:hypothetical protein
MPAGEQSERGFVAAGEKPSEKLRIFQASSFGNPGGSPKVPKQIGKQSAGHRDDSLVHSPLNVLRLRPP